MTGTHAATSHPRWAIGRAFLRGMGWKPSGGRHKADRPSVPAVLGVEDFTDEIAAHFGAVEATRFDHASGIGRGHVQSGVVDPDCGFCTGGEGR